jgi:hypothetical protein
MVHIMYLIFFLFLLAQRSQQVLCSGFERGLKPPPNEVRVIIIKHNLTTNYQLSLNCNKVNSAHYYYSHSFRSKGKKMTIFSKQSYEEGDGRIMKAARKQHYIMFPAPISFLDDDFPIFELSIRAFDIQRGWGDAYERQREYTRRDLFMGKLNLEKFSERLQELNRYLDFILIEKNKRHSKCYKGIWKILARR